MLLWYPQFSRELISKEQTMACSTLTEIVVVLDRSGSMGSVQMARIKAFNGYVKSKKPELGPFNFH